MKILSIEMARREFLKKAVLSSAGLASFPALAQVLAKPVFADDGQTNFIFVAATVFGPPPPGSPVNFEGDLFIINGSGKVTGAQVVGGGSATHLDPDTGVVVGFGTWKAKRLVSLDLVGTLGAHAAGVLTMEVNLLPTGGPVTPTTIIQVCDLPGLNAPGDEGVTVITPFGTATNAPGFGLTLFSTGVEQRD